VLVLALESATEVSGVALADDEGLLASAVSGRGRRHGEHLAAAVEFVCARAGRRLGELDALAVDVGPGLFTGVRVGVATAKALAFALGIPAVAVSSLELLALSSAPWPAAAGGGGGDALLVPVVDARRGLVFAGRYRAVAGEPAAVEQVGEDRLLEPGDLAGEIAALVAAGRRCLCAGDGARRYAGLLGAAGAEAVAAVAPSPDVAVLAALGLRRAGEGAGVPAAMLEARYLREADVRINWEQRLAPRPLAAP
jgi:tRNA threonylcarbamoyladenosine biosynthesis protein TsaB